MPSEKVDTQGAAPVPGSLVVSSIENCRDLGGYPTPSGFTQPHRFLRSGNTSGVTSRDAELLRSWGLARVLDLRSPEEAAKRPDAFAGVRGIRYKEVPLHNTNLHDPRLAPQHSADAMDDFLVNGYLTMLGNRQAVRKTFRFFSRAKASQCVLFHCAAGMDRTGVIALLLLGLAGVDRDHIRADYGYSFGPLEAVNQLVFGEPVLPQSLSRQTLPERKTASPGNGRTEAPSTDGRDIEHTHARGDARLGAPRNAQPDPLYGLDAEAVKSLDALCRLMGNVYDRLLDAYGSVEKYLEACGCKPRELERVKAHLLEP